MEFYLKRIGAPSRGGFYSYGKRFIERLPIILPEKHIADRQTTLATRQLERGRQIAGIREKLTDEKAQLEEEVKRTDEEINNIVFDIFGITGTEIQLIEESMTQKSSLQTELS